MKITITSEPHYRDNNSVEFSIKLSAWGREDAGITRVIPMDWFEDNSIFKRIVMDMADTLQRVHNEMVSRPNQQCN